MHVDTDDDVVQITFDRPGVKNAFSTETARELADVVDDVSSATHAAIVLTGTGEAFSAGGDVQAMADRPATQQATYDRLTESFGRVVETFLECSVPIVAKVNGDAVGAGLSLVALSDLAYAVESARFSCAFVRVGLIPDTGGTFLLPHLLGLRAAKELAFTGQFVDAERAAEIDLINEAVPEDALEARVDDCLETLRRQPTATIGLMKRAIHENLGRHWQTALEYENRLQVQATATDAHEEGVSAFLEGRAPEFTRD